MSLPRSRPRVVLVFLCILLLGVFALYARAIALMPFHDDAVLMPAINTRTLITIFENRPYGDGHHRPMSYMPWLLTRDLFGWFSAPILHWWNVAAHVLNTALVASLAARLGKRFGLDTPTLPALPVISGALFGFAPLSYEAVLWASALVHPWMAMFGLFAVHAALSRRWGAAAVLVLAACLSHEMGFVFGALIVLMESMLAHAQRRRFSWLAIGLGTLAFAYALVYRFVLITKWTDPASRDYARSPIEIIANLAYQAQSFVAWAFSLLGGVLQPVYSQPFMLIGAAFALLIGCAALVFLRARHMFLGLLTFLIWIVLIGPSTLLLTQDYVWSSPRMTYVPAIGMALFWGVAIASTVAAWFTDTARRKNIRMGMGFLVCIGFLITHARFIDLRTVEALRLTPALRQIDANLQTSLEDEKLLLINSSFVNLAAQPTYPIGKEGLPLWEYGYKVMDGPMWAWPGAVSGTVRETMNVRHAASLTNRNPDATGDYFFTVPNGQPFYYGIFGEEVDDAMLRQRIAEADMVYRFDYDLPGFRATRLMEVAPASTLSLSSTATLSMTNARIDIAFAQASRCDDHVYLEITWANKRDVANSVGVFVHGYTADGQQVLVADRDPIGGYVPLESLPEGKAIVETREIRVPANTPLLVATIHLGIYDRATGQRFTATRVDGTRWDNDEIIVPIHTGALQSDVCP
jgi:hypothetical protein